MHQQIFREKPLNYNILKVIKFQGDIRRENTPAPSRPLRVSYLHNTYSIIVCWIHFPKDIFCKLSIFVNLCFFIKPNETRLKALL